jgi:EAL domain-containing protein (putative c-di-GMP-specific phosphodiesterase class I)
MMADPARSIGVLGSLSSVGVELSIDDFGTGYSSLSYLRRLPIDEIKIDRSFVSRMHVDQDDAMIVRATVELGRNLGLRVVAEGVENAETWDQLRVLGCDVAQGYFLSKALPSAEATKWLATRSPGPAASPAISQDRVETDARAHRNLRAI